MSYVCMQKCFCFVELLLQNCSVPPKNRYLSNVLMCKPDPLCGSTQPISLFVEKPLYGIYRVQFLLSLLLWLSAQFVLDLVWKFQKLITILSYSFILILSATSFELCLDAVLLQYGYVADRRYPINGVTYSILDEP